jgi:thiamine-phosphate diphosphorylase
VPPTLCLITDARRLVAAIGRPPEVWPQALLEQVEGAIAGGVDLVQIRERRADAAVLADVTRGCVALTRGSRTRVVVNDRADVAIAAAAHGLHLREDSFPAGAVRRLSAGWVIGRSVHDAGGALAGGGADYLIAGSVLPTASKPGMPASLGVEGLRSVVAAAGRVPVLAVGGLTVENLTVILGTGASGLAAIGAFQPTEQVSDLRAAVQTLTKNLRFAFDSLPGLP